MRGGSTPQAAKNLNALFEPRKGVLDVVRTQESQQWGGVVLLAATPRPEKHLNALFEPRKGVLDAFRTHSGQATCFWGAQTSQMHFLSPEQAF